MALLSIIDSLNFIGTKEYFEHKEIMFRDSAEIFLNNDQAFLLEKSETENYMSRPISVEKVCIILNSQLLKKF